LARIPSDLIVTVCETVVTVHKY